jgi:hypothetical protein
MCPPVDSTNLTGPPATQKYQFGTELRRLS